MSSSVQLLNSEETPDQAQVPPPDDLPETIVEARPGWHLLNVRELWRFRELLFFLVWRDVKVRYKQTLLGGLWAVLQPVSFMLVFTIIFGGLGRMPSRNIPHPLFFFTGLLPWTFFANAITSAGQSVVSSQDLITKVYFPRLLIPVAASFAGLIDFAIGFGVLVLMMWYYGFTLSWSMLLVPLLVLGLLLTAVGVGALLAALTVAYRDFRYVVPFMVQLWMFLTPTIYMPTYDEFNPRWRVVLPLNPGHGIISNFRAALLDREIDSYSLLVSLGVGLFLFLLGCLYFRRVEREFADII